MRDLLELYFPFTSCKLPYCIAVVCCRWKLRAERLLASSGRRLGTRLFMHQCVVCACFNMLSLPLQLVWLPERESNCVPVLELLSEHLSLWFRFTVSLTLMQRINKPTAKLTMDDLQLARAWVAQDRSRIKFVFATKQ